MSLFRRLRRRESDGEVINVAITGAGFIGSALVRQVDITPGMRTALVINRTVDRAVEALVRAGHDRAGIVVSDDPACLRAAILDRRPAVTRRAEMLAAIDAPDVVVEATGAVAYGAEVALHAIEGGCHVVMLNAEADATVGCALYTRAEAGGVVYTNADGDQPGVLARMIDWVDGMGFDVVAAVNCKGFMDVHATPESIAPWAERQGTSPLMTTAFTDGTKMNIENAVIANATGLRPECRGMHGVRTTLESALEDCLAAYRGSGLVDYTLGGDFGGGVFVIGRGDDAVNVRAYMSYLKMGDGPHYLFFRPFHLCHLEVPLSIAEAVLDATPTIAPIGAPVADVVALAKRDLRVGERLDGIGGYTVYGEVDTIDRAAGLLPIGLADNVTLTRDVAKGEAVPMSAVELDPGAMLMRLRAEMIDQRSAA